MNNTPKYKTHTSNEVKKRYNDKTYTRLTVNFRNDEDAELIDYLERKKAEGILPSAAVRELFEISRRGE